MNAATCNKITQVAYDTYYKDNKYNVSVNLYKYYKFAYIIRDKNDKDIILCCGLIYYHYYMYLSVLKDFDDFDYGTITIEPMEVL
jgi:hypothetical protein